MLKRLKRRRANVEAGVAEDKPDPVTHKEPATIYSGIRRSKRKASNVQPFTVHGHTDMDVDQSQDEGVRASAAFTASLQDASRATQYASTRQQLLADEKADAWDARARSRASSIELRAAKLVRLICERERAGPLFGNLAGESEPGAATRDMGGRFLINKDRIQDSVVFQIARIVPKGAHLHLHFNSELPPEALLQFARRSVELRDTLVIRSTRPLCNKDDFYYTEIVFGVLQKGTPCGDLFSNDYEPDLKVSNSRAWMRWSDFRQILPEVVKRLQANICSENDDTAGNIKLDLAERWVREKMIVTKQLKYERAPTHNQMWACFNQGTRAFKGLLNYASVYRWYIGHLIQSMVDQRVMYAELRPMLMDKTIPSDDGTEVLDHKAQMTIIIEEVRRKQGELREAGQIDKFPFGLKIIYCAPRSIKKERMQIELADCLKLKLQFPDLICGFDLVGAEDRPNSVGFYADLLLAFTQSCKQLGITIPFMFHAGETLLDTGGSENPDNSNLYDALLLNAVRIGHGYSLIKHPMLIERYKKANIALELCPISNELLGLCGNAREHPYPALLAAGLHCTLNADNPALYRGTSHHRSYLSHEFYQVMVGDTRMSLHGWKQLAEWSIEHACLTDEEKRHGLEILRGEWEVFCETIVKEYAVEYER